MASWLDRIFGKSKTREHYEREADKAAPLFTDHRPDLFDEYQPSGVGEAIDEDPDFVDEHGNLLPKGDPHGFGASESIEFLDLEGKSECVKWISYDHSNGSCLIQYLEHGKPGRLYRYEGLSRQDFLDIDDGVGPFPIDRAPHYLKDESPGQNVNFYLRNDHADDGEHRNSGSRFTYERIG